MTIETLIKDVTAKMDQGINHFKSILEGLRTGKASTNLVQDIMVDAYGSRMKLRDIANINTPDARTISIIPYDMTISKEIEKGIMMSHIGITPINDGKTIRLPMPELSEERRKEMVKMVKAKAEDHKIELRNIRRDANEFAKKSHKNSEITEDDLKLYLDDIQKLTDKKIIEISTLAEVKEKELMTV
jgi:ribosome recycling factor